MDSSIIRDLTFGDFSLSLFPEQKDKLPNNFKEIADKAFEITNGKDPEVKTIVLVKGELFDVDIFVAVLLFSLIKTLENKKIRCFYVSELGFQSHKLLRNFKTDCIDMRNSGGRYICFNNKALIVVDRIKPNDEFYFSLALHSKCFDLSVINDSDLLSLQNENYLYKTMCRSNCNNLCIHIVDKGKKDELLSRFGDRKHYLFEV
jgi:hypothetical protein